MKRFFAAILLIAMVASVTFTVDAKRRTNRKKAQTESTAGLTALERKVVGKHMLSLQWISWESFGTVEIKKEADGTFSCRGEQMARKCKRGTEQGNIDNDDYVKLDGTITIVDDTHLVFNGEIRTKVYHINHGEEVLRQGTFNFVATQNRKFWRMQEMLNPVDECTDYVDIYFKR